MIRAITALHELATFPSSITRVFMDLSKSISRNYELLLDNVIVIIELAYPGAISP